MNEALELWKKWFEWSGDPWEDDDYGNITCFFCSEDKPKHSEDCVFVQAQKLIAIGQDE